METRFNREILIRQANLESFLGVYGDVVTPESPVERRAPAPVTHARFRNQPLVSEYSARSAGDSFPSRMLSAVQQNITSNPGRALESQGNLSSYNVSSLLEMM